jgi:cob(I)alamin adenosyltransferase
MASKIYTKKGDAGYTSVMGTRDKYPKSHPRLDAVGTVDELNSHVGLLRSYVSSEVSLDREINIIEQIQNTLFEIGSELAMIEYDPEAKFNSYDDEIKQLESEMDIMSKNLTPLKNFILPAGPPIVCQAHIARVVTRRAERSVNKVMLNAKKYGEIINPDLIRYINRLSDYFFVLARFLSHHLNIPETIWKSKK